jgi:hypothetical protein
VFLLVLGASLIGGCTNGTSANPSAQATSASAGSTSTAAPHAVALGDADKGRTVTVAVGDQVVLTLANTYWRIADPRPPAILVPLGAPAVNPSPPNAPNCVPGEGCGTVSASFRATKPGTAILEARRTTCGEARGCVNGEGAYQVTISVQ